VHQNRPWLQRGTIQACRRKGSGNAGFQEGCSSAAPATHFHERKKIPRTPPVVKEQSETTFWRKEGGEGPSRELAENRILHEISLRLGEYAVQHAAYNATPAFEI
jgi:hypothetical protein